jgi:hypothetical protein
MWHVWGRRKAAYRVLVGISEGKGQLERPSRRREDSIKRDFKETDYEEVI